MNHHSLGAARATAQLLANRSNMGHGLPLLSAHRDPRRVGVALERSMSSH